MDADERGFRVAIVADELVNPPAGGFDALEVLQQEDWGAIQLPPAWYPPPIATQFLEQVAEHAEEFTRHGYDVVIVGGRAGLAEALNGVGIAEPDTVAAETADELRQFLRARPPVDPKLGRHTVQ
jgi:hypothetical protein